MEEKKIVKEIYTKINSDRNICCMSRETICVCDACAYAQAYGCVCSGLGEFNSKTNKLPHLF